MVRAVHEDRSFYFIAAETEMDQLSDYKRNDYSAIAGIGFNIFDKMYIDCRYVYGFTPIRDC